MGIVCEGLSATPSQGGADPRPTTRRGSLRGLAPSCERRREPPRTIPVWCAGILPIRLLKPLGSKMEAYGKVRGSGLCIYASQILQLEERPWPVSACARVLFLRCRRRRKRTDSPIRRTRSRRTRPFGRTPNRPEARCRLNRPRPTSRPPGLP